MKSIGKRTLRDRDLLWRGWPYLFVLLIVFAIGALFGFILAFLSEPSTELKSYLTNHFDVAAKSEFGLSFFSVLWDCIRWPLLVFVFRFTAAGIVVIPAIFLVRGFLLSYTAACFGVLLGNVGVIAAAVLFAVTVLLILPILFVIGCECFCGACARLPGLSSAGESRLRAEVFLPSFGVLAIAVSLQWTVVPILLSAVCARLF